MCRECCYGTYKGGMTCEHTNAFMRCGSAPQTDGAIKARGDEAAVFQ